MSLRVLLHGIMRVRAFTQDDAHIFCTEDQINSETVDFCNLLLDIYRDFGFEDVRVKFSDRPEVRAGDDATWDKAEAALRDATAAAGLDTELNPGRARFMARNLNLFCVMRLVATGSAVPYRLILFCQIVLMRNMSPKMAAVSVL